MDLIAKAAEALEPISAEGIVVQQGWYDKSLHARHVTLWTLSDAPDASSDDDLEIETGMIQVTIFSQEDEVDLAERIRKLMTAAGWTWIAGDQDDTMNDGGIIIKPQRFMYQEEKENER